MSANGTQVGRRAPPEPLVVGVHSPALVVVQIETGPPEQRIGAAAELRDYLGGTCG
jgi:hypothetical protein